MKKHPHRPTPASGAGMISVKETDSLQTSINRSGIFYACLLAVGLIFATNLIWPQSYDFLAWNYLSFYPFWMQMAWGLGVVGLLLGARWVILRPSVKTGWVMGAALTAIVLAGLALVYWRTPYPSLMGDGESLRIGGTHDPRWPIVLAHWLASVFLHHDAVSAWWMLETGYGFIYIGLAAFIAWTFRAQPWAAVGLLFWLLGTPVLMNACGHLDSLASVLVSGTLWWMALWKLDGAQGWAGLIRWGLILLLVALLAVGSTPFNLFLLVLSGAVVGMRIIRLLKWLRLWRVLTFIALPVLYFGLVGGLMVKAIGGNVFFVPTKVAGVEVQVLQGEYLWFFLKSTLFLYLNVALPAAFVGLWALLRRRAGVKQPWDEVQIVTLAGFLVSWALTVAPMQGINDETATAPVGMLALGSAAMLFLRGGITKSHVGILFVGILALALQVPRLALYSSHRFVDRYEKLYPYDRCGTNNQMSPYVHLGLMLHPYDQYCREARLRVFREGANSPLPYWSQFRLSNLMYYTAWCYEYGQYDEGRAALRIMLKVAPGNVPYLVSPGTMFTHRNKNQAYLRIRPEVKALLATEFAGPGNSPIYGQLRQFLKDVENQPTPEVPPSFWSGDALKSKPTDGPFMTWYNKTAQADETKLLQWYFRKVEDSQKQDSKNKSEFGKAP